MVLWYLYHRDISVYQAHDGDWYLLAPADCGNLTPDGLCAVYLNRPYICREYELDGCEGTSAAPPEKLRFDDAPSFLAWLRMSRPSLWERSLTAGVVPPALVPTGEDRPRPRGVRPEASAAPGAARRRRQTAPGGTWRATSSGPRPRPR